MWKTATVLIALVLVLLALGIVMVGSASRVKGQSAQLADPSYYLRRQILWLLLASIAGVLASHFDYHVLREKWAVRGLMTLALVLLVCVWVPGIGKKAGGSYRWLRIGMLSFQPSELAKFMIVVFLAAQMARVQLRADHLKEGFLLPILPLGVAVLLIFLEPDYGTAFLTAMVGMTVMFVGGARLTHLVLAGTLGMCSFVVAVMQNTLRMNRILAFLDPAKHPDIAYHLQHSEYAFIMGRAVGVGLNRSTEKHFYLPEAHTDFIFSIVGEELGLVWTLGVLALYLGVMVCGLRISLHARDPFGRLLAFGLTIMISMQAVINIAVVTGCMPTKGLALPFISYGGSSLLMSLVAVGVLVNIARQVDRRA
ncbi:MAG: putative lipid II flippase FtsW [Kiritimatiellae bacterium]|nr:putative lipid II flippase FtsW [Kiritimatiellia bacterium]